MSAVAHANELVSLPVKAESRSGEISLGRVFVGILMLLELTLIAAFGIYAARNYLDFDPNLRMHGFEPEWMNQNPEYVAATWQSQSYFPRWNPYMGLGMPSIDHGHAFVINPFTFLPTLLLGPVQGVKVGVAIHYVLMGVSGWVLGRTLGWGLPARLLLAGLLLSRGGFSGILGFGYFQLAAQQVYIPFALAGAIGLFRSAHKRRHVVLLALSMALIFHSGNIYYILPAAMLIGFVFVFYGCTLYRRPLRLSVDVQYARRFVAATLAAGGLMAVTALPIFVYYRYLGAHPGYVPTPRPFSAEFAFYQFFTPTMLYPGEMWIENFYSYVTPIWLLMLFIIVLPIRWLYYTDRPAWDARLWGLLITAFLFFFTWGMQWNPLMNWLYENISFFAQFRMPERMIPVASMLLAIMLAFRIDALWKALMRRSPPDATFGRRMFSAATHLSALSLVGVSVLAPWEVNANRNYNFSLSVRDRSWDQCIAWLQENYGGTNQFLSVIPEHNHNVTSFIEHNVRMTRIVADYDQLGVAPTIYDGDLTNMLPPYMIPEYNTGFEFWRARGYEFLPGSPPRYPDQDMPCFMYNPNTLAFAFTAPQSLYSTQWGEAFPVEQTAPAETLFVSPEHITVQAQTRGDQEATVLAVQNIAYPGWEVRVDGNPAKLESVGQLMGVVLQPKETPYIIEFSYVPRLFAVSGVITIATALLCIAYLLRLERLLPPPLRRVPSFGLSLGNILTYGSEHLRLPSFTPQTFIPQRSGAPSRLSLDIDKQIFLNTGQKIVQFIKVHDLRWVVGLTEIVLVVVFSLFVTRNFLNFDPNLRNHGMESEWLNSTMEWMSLTLHEQGYIPRWLPYINRGMPSIDQGHAYLINPFASVPSLILGTADGLRIATLLLTITAGLGGLTLGYTLNWGVPVRLLLAGLLITNSPMQAGFGWGYFQLAGQLAYFPWIFAGIIGIVKKRLTRRYVGLLAISAALLFHIGNIVFILPAALLSLFLSLALIVHFKPKLGIDRKAATRLLLAVMFALGLIAVTALPILVHFPYIGGHGDYIPSSTPEPWLPRFMQLFTPAVQPWLASPWNWGLEYTYVVPLWLVIALFLLLPPILRLFYRSIDRNTTRRLWIFLLCGFLFFFLWGITANLIVNWLYATVPVLRQWRFFERFLSIAALLLIILVALRAEGLWRAFTEYFYVHPRSTWRSILLGTGAAGFIAIAVIAPLEVANTRQMGFALDRPDFGTETCLSSLRQAYPNEHITVGTMNDHVMYAFLWNRLQNSTLYTHYDQMGRSPTLFEGDLTNIKPKYLLLAWNDNGDGFREHGYVPLESVPYEDGSRNCFVYNPNAVQYAFTIPVSTLQTNDLALVETGTTTAQVVFEQAEHIAIRVENTTDEAQAVVAQTIAYPGWEARIDGNPAKLESVGQLLGVVLPPNSGTHLVEFVYVPRLFYVGGAITIATAIFIMLYLLKAERLLYHFANARANSVNSAFFATPAITPIAVEIPPTVPDETLEK